MNFWLVCGLMISTSLVAQQASNTPAAAPLQTPPAAPAAAPVTNPTAEAPVVTPATTSTNAPAGTNAPAKSGKKKGGTKKKKGGKNAAPKKPSMTYELKTTPLEPGVATVIASNVNVRGQAKLRSEVVGHVNKDDAVTVLGEVTLEHSAPDEPSAWAKIIAPPGTHVWVNGNFIDANKTITARHLNLRGGPGENYSVLGILDKGATVNQIGSKGDWIQIDPPTNAYAFVAAQYLKQEAPATQVAANTPPPPQTTNIVAESPMPAPATNNPPVETVPPPSVPATTNTAETAAAPVAAPATNTTVAAQPEQPLPPRIVLRDGFVRGTVSIQAPTQFELVSPDSGKVMNYLYSTSTNFDLRRFKGLRILVSGEEGLDERWRNTPVLTIQRLQVIQ